MLLVVGCSSKVFNSEIVSDDATALFTQLLASRDLMDEARDDKIAGILRLKPFFEAGSASYDWAGDSDYGPTPGTSGHYVEQAEEISTLEEVEGEAYIDDDGFSGDEE